MKRGKNILVSAMTLAAFFTQSTFMHAQPASLTPASADQAIRTFRVHFPDRDLADLRNRIKATNWPDAETVGDVSQGGKTGHHEKAGRLLGQ